MTFFLISILAIILSTVTGVFLGRVGAQVLKCDEAIVNISALGCALASIFATVLYALAVLSPSPVDGATLILTASDYCLTVVPAGVLFGLVSAAASTSVSLAVRGSILFCAWMRQASPK